MFFLPLAKLYYQSSHGERAHAGVFGAFWQPYHVHPCQRRWFEFKRPKWLEGRVQSIICFVCCVVAESMQLLVSYLDSTCALCMTEFTCTPPLQNSYWRETTFEYFRASCQKTRGSYRENLLPNYFAGPGRAAPARPRRLGLLTEWSSYLNKFQWNYCGVSQKFQWQEFWATCRINSSSSFFGSHVAGGGGWRAGYLSWYRALRLYHLRAPVAKRKVLTLPCEIVTT